MVVEASQITLLLVKSSFEQGSLGRRKNVCCPGDFRILAPMSPTGVVVCTARHLRTRDERALSCVNCQSFFRAACSFGTKPSTVTGALGQQSFKLEAIHSEWPALRRRRRIYSYEPWGVESPSDRGPFWAARRGCSGRRGGRGGADVTVEAGLGVAAVAEGRKEKILFREGMKEEEEEHPEKDASLSTHAEGRRHCSRKRPKWLRDWESFVFRSIPNVFLYPQLVILLTSTFSTSKEPSYTS